MAKKPDRLGSHLFHAGERVRSLLGRLFGRKPKAPTVRAQRTGEVIGHRGIAAGSLAEPDLSAENVAKWRTLPGDAIAAFVHDSEPLFFHSTNVSMAQYFADEKKLMVEFKNGSAYIYSDISEGEAIQIAQAQSKGGWIWSHLRIRGTKRGHKKAYRRIK